MRINKRIDDYNEELEEWIIKLWKQMRPTQKHMACMYLYRLRTEEPKNMGLYYETYFFNKMGLTVDDLPTYLVRMSEKKLYEEAYEYTGHNGEV